MRTVITTIVIAAALTASAASAGARPAGEYPPASNDPTLAIAPEPPAGSVPSQPGEPGGASMRPRQAATDSSDGVDWATIGITIGGTVVLLGAVISLAMRTRHRTSRTRLVA